MKVLDHAFRIFVGSEASAATVNYYEDLQGVSCDRRIAMPDLGIDVAVVGAFVILAGSDEALAPYRATSALLRVEHLDEAIAWCVSQGATLLHGPVDLPNGRNATLRHPDGLIAEYFAASREA